MTAASGCWFPRPLGPSLPHIQSQEVDNTQGTKEDWYHDSSVGLVEEKRDKDKLTASGRQASRMNGGGCFKLLSVHVRHFELLLKCMCAIVSIWRQHVFTNEQFLKPQFAGNIDQVKKYKILNLQVTTLQVFI